MALLFSALDRRALAALAGRLGAYRVRVVLALATFAAAGGLIIFLGQGVRTFVDHGLHGDEADLRLAAGRLFALAFLYGLAGMGRSYLSNFIGDRVATDLREDAFTRLLREEVSALDGEGAALVWSQVVTDASVVQSMINSLIGLCRNLIVVAGGLAAMVLTDLRLSGLVLVIAPFVIALVAFFGRTLRPLSDAAQRRAARAEALALESLDGVRAIKAFVQEREAAARYVAVTEESFSLANRRNRRQAVLAGVGVWAMFGAAIIIGWAAGSAVVAHHISEGLATAFLFYTVVVAASGAAVADAVGQLNKGLGALTRVNQTGRRPEEPSVRSERPERRSGPAPQNPAPELSPPPATASGPRPRGGPIEFREVSFSYPLRPETRVLDALDITFPEGRSAALVGRSGAGKTTLFQLLLRFYAPSGGAVRLGGRDLAAWSLADLRRQIGLVPQDPALFEGTISENIRFGRPSADRRSILAAAEAANALEFIDELPMGLETVVGPRGAQLSGGQRQRIAIARAVLKDAPILLLDEATNALDARSESLIRSAVRTFAAGRTTLMIAHRLSTVRDADLILVLEGGRLVASGSHEALMAEEGLYAELAALQLQP